VRSGPKKTSERDRSRERDFRKKRAAGAERKIGERERIGERAMSSRKFPYNMRGYTIITCEAI
jgi:hypothetical protein